VAEPLTIEEARDALKDTVPDLDRYLADSRIEIVSARDWFLQGGTFDSKRVIDTIAMSRMVPRSSLLRNGEDPDGHYRNI
jgi:hypothetical protein